MVVFILNVANLFWFWETLLLCLSKCTGLPSVTLRWPSRKQDVSVEKLISYQRSDHNSFNQHIFTWEPNIYLITLVTSWKTHMTQHIIIPRAKFITVKIHKAKLAKGKDTLDTSFQESSFRGVLQDALNSSPNKSWQCVGLAKGK